VTGVKQLKWEAARESKFNKKHGKLQHKQKRVGRTVKRLKRSRRTASVGQSDETDTCYAQI